MYFAGKMKCYIRIIGDFGIQKPFTLCQVNGIPVFIFRRVLLFKPKKLLQFLRLITGKPASFEKRQGTEFAGGTIFL